MYSELKEGRLYFGPHTEAAKVAKEQGIDVVVDVRVNGESQPEQLAYNYSHMPIADEDLTASTLKQTAEAIKAAYDEGKAVYFHCGGGNGRACVTATATLLELGEAATVDEAIAQVTAKRPTANIRPAMEAALRSIYEGK
ncbi:MAG TPA: dual specificity protein phosphatase family protein [Metalysinibacillus jejuensis]|uniref:protein-tyrosine-phosphatase n=1 Tax=Metalysinibacillus jejuensis TaxID=914327 RepID=A0A921T3Z5_9BACL|nr:dual specificity protein phosphatase family protein [Metalysinibacillus jejuensis]